MALMLYWVRYAECGCEEGLGIPETSTCKTHGTPVELVNSAHKIIPPRDGWIPLQQLLSAPMQDIKPLPFRKDNLSPSRRAMLAPKRRV